jgi:hypothetical protein
MSGTYDVRTFTAQYDPIWQHLKDPNERHDLNRAFIDALENVHRSGMGNSLVDPTGRYQVTRSEVKTGGHYEGSGDSVTWVDSYAPAYSVYQIGQGAGTLIPQFDSEGRFKEHTFGAKAMSGAQGLALVVASALTFGAVGAATAAGGAAAGAAEAGSIAAAAGDAGLMYAGADAAAATSLGMGGVASAGQAVASGVSALASGSPLALAKTAVSTLGTIKSVAGMLNSGGGGGGSPGIILGNPAGGAAGSAPAAAATQGPAVQFVPVGGNSGGDLPEITVTAQREPAAPTNYWPLIIVGGIAIFAIAKRGK